MISNMVPYPGEPGGEKLVTDIATITVLIVVISISFFLLQVYGIELPV
jgi:hypothetical protein